MLTAFSHAVVLKPFAKPSLSGAYEKVVDKKKSQEDTKKKDSSLPGISTASTSQSISFSLPELSKEFVSIRFSFYQVFSKTSLASPAYTVRQHFWQTLFTHIICPNAP